ncbi:MAG: hypothetical protein ACF8Q5_01085 [Phycisphaerales bacterium JB040]
MRRTRRALHTLSIGAVCVGGYLCPVVSAQDERRDPEPVAVEMVEARELIERLRLGASALERLERHDLSREVRALAERLHARAERARGGETPESDARERVARRLAEDRLGVLRHAFDVIVESGNRDLAEQMGRAVRVYQAALEGLEGEAARRAREIVPDQATTMELIGHAAHLLREQDRADAAERLLGARDRLWEGWRDRPSGDRDARPQDGRRARQDAHAEAPADGPDRERAWQRRHLEMLEVAAHGFREAQRREQVELLERAMHATRMNLEGREDPESHGIRERAPGLEDRIRLLAMASRVWGEFGHETRSATLREYASELARMARERQARAGQSAQGEQPKPRPGETGAVRQERAAAVREARQRELRRVLEDLEAQLERVREELESLRNRDG